MVGVGAIRFGMSRTAVHEALGKPIRSFKKSPTSPHPTDSWHDSGFQVFYAGTDPLVNFIELSGISGFEAVCFGHEVFSTPASKLVDLFTVHAEYDAADPELGYSYVFPSIELALWRPVQEEPEGLYFSTIGIGVHGYFSAASAVQLSVQPEVPEKLGHSG